MSYTPRAAAPAPVVETKVTWATIGAYLASLFLVAIANGLQDVDHALVLGAMPEALETILLPALPAAVTFVSGWLAKHTPRPDLVRRGAPTETPEIP